MLPLLSVVSGAAAGGDSLKCTCAAFGFHDPGAGGFWESPIGAPTVVDGTAAIAVPPSFCAAALLLLLFLRFRAIF